MRKLVALALLCAGPVLGAWSKAYTVTVDRTKCGSSNLTNFPVYISVSDNSLKDVAHGGTVTSSSGFDIVVATDSTITTYVPWEIEKWDNVAGTLAMWAKLSTVNGSSAVSNTTFGVAWGNAAITTQQNTGSYAPTAVWDSNYKMVQHASTNPPASATLPDSTTNANNAAGDPNLSAITGLMDGAVNGGLGGSAGSAVVTTTTAFPTGSNSLTFSLWWKSNYSGGRHFAASYGDLTVAYHGISFAQDGVTVYAGAAGHEEIVNLSSTLNQWAYLVITYDGTTQRFYSDGVLVSSSAQPYALTGNYLGQQVWLWASYGSFAWFQPLDEIRMSAGIARSGDWILSEFNNQANPGNIGAPNFLIWGGPGASAAGSFAILY